MISQDSSRRLNNIVTNALSIASEIDELGINTGDYAEISSELKKQASINLMQLRNICDSLMAVNRYVQGRSILNSLLKG